MHTAMCVHRMLLSVIQLTCENVSVCVHLCIYLFIICMSIDLDQREHMKYNYRKTGSLKVNLYVRAKCKEKPSFILVLEAENNEFIVDYLSNRILPFWYTWCLCFSPLPSKFWDDYFKSLLFNICL